MNPRTHPKALSILAIAAGVLVTVVTPSIAQTVHSFNVGDRTVTGDVPAANNPNGLQITGETGTWPNLAGNTSAPGTDISATDDGVTLTFLSVIWNGTVGDPRGNNVGTRAMRIFTGYGSLDTAWTLTGLTPNSFYDMTFYNKRESPGESRRPNCGIDGFDAGNGVGAAGPVDDDQDQDFIAVQADEDGKISGTWWITGFTGGGGITAIAGLQVVQSAGPPGPFKLVITSSGTVPGSYDFSWASQDDKVYDLISSTDLTIPTSSWDVWNGQTEIAGTSPANSLVGIAGGGSERYFAMIERDPPLPLLLNGGFEEPTTVDGGFGTLAAPWTTVDLFGSAAVDIWNPTTSDYAAVPEGENVCSAYVPGSAPGTPFGVSQVLGETYATGTNYSLNVKVGRSAASPGAGYDWPGFRIELWAGGILLGSDEDPTTTAPSPGNFITSTISYDHTAGPAATPGDALEIRLLSRGEDVESVGTSTNGWSVEFDDVVFTITTP